MQLFKSDATDGLIGFLLVIGEIVCSEALNVQAGVGATIDR